MARTSLSQTITELAAVALLSVLVLATPGNAATAQEFMNQMQWSRQQLRSSGSQKPETPQGLATKKGQVPASGTPYGTSQLPQRSYEKNK